MLRVLELFFKIYLRLIVMPLTPLIVFFTVSFALIMLRYKSKFLKKMKNLVEECNMCTCNVIMHVTVWTVSTVDLYRGHEQEIFISSRFYSYPWKVQMNHHDVDWYWQDLNIRVCNKAFVSLMLWGKDLMWTDIHVKCILESAN